MNRTLRTTVLGLLVSFAACDNPLPGDEICRDIGYAIVNKSFECSGDVNSSNQAYEDFTSAHACKISDLPSEGQLENDHISDTPQDSVGDPYQCSASILKLSCDQVAALGTDYDRWMSTANFKECSVVYDAASGGPLPEVGGAGGAGGVGGAVGLGGGGAGGTGGQAGAGGMVPSLITLHASGAIGSSAIEADCTQRSSPDLIFTCEGAGGVSTQITLKSIMAGGLAGYDLIDPAFNFQFDAPGVATTLSPGDTFTQLSATTTIISPPVSGLVSLDLYIAIQRTSSPPLSLIIKGAADHVPCGSACGH